MAQLHSAIPALEHAAPSQPLRLVELLPCPALIFSADDTILAANRLFCALLGYGPAGLPQQRLADLSDWPERQRDADMRARLHGEALSELAYEKNFLGKDGKAIRCEVALKCIGGDHGPMHYLALVRPLGQSRQRDDIDIDDAAERILQAIDEGFVLLDHDFRVLRINDAALRIDGRPRADIVGRSHWDAWPGSADLPIGAAYRKVMADRVPVSIEQRYPHAGQEVWIEARAFPFGEGVAVFYRDITRRKEAEHALRDSEARFRTIADAMPQIVWSTRPDGFHDYFNQQWYDYTGVPPGASHGDAWIGLFHPDDQPIMLARWQHSLATGEPYEVEFRIRHRTGGYRWVLGRALPVRDEHGQIVRWIGTSTDIHERILVQEKLQDTQARLEAALTAAEIGTWTWDIPADRMHADRNLAAMFGIPPEEADQHPSGDYLAAVHPDDIAAVRDALERALTTDEAYQERFRARRPDGQIRTMQARGTVLKDAGGRPLRMSGAVLDISRQQLAEQARLVSEAKFQTIVDSDVIGIVEYHFDGTLAKVNGAFLHMLGYSRAHFDEHGLSWRALTPPEWAAADEQAWASLHATGRMDAIEKEYFRSDGSRVPVYMGAANFAGSRDTGIAYILDISEAKKAEAALRSSELTFRTLADNIPQLAWMADSRGDIFWYNNRWFDYTGTTLDDMKGWGWAKVHHPDHVARVVECYRQQIVEAQTVWEDTFPLRGADGQYRWFLSRAQPIRDEHGRVLRWLGTNTDVTLQREAEEALQQESRRKDDFLAMLAHELRNPLAPISTASQLLKMGARNPEHVQRSSDIIERQVKHLSDLVNDLMDVSRVTRGLVSIEQTEVDIEQVVTAAVEQSRPLIEARKQELVLELLDGGASVSGDHTRLVQVLANLLNNAAKYTQQGGRIALATRVRGSELEISVSDNGIGMDAVLLPHVFELFTQAERTPDRSEGGLGLGLALVKSIVALHGGRIEAGSAGKGMGSTFTVTLPLSQAAAGAARRLRILLVGPADDEDVALASALQADGHEVVNCHDSACALACDAAQRTDAVLICTDLVGVDGYGLARELRARHPQAPAAFIALTSSEQSHDKIIARGAGFDQQLVRPVTLAALRKVLPVVPVS